MTSPRLTLDPWVICEPVVHPEAVATAESVFALGNGHIGVRGTLDEVEPHGIPGTFVAGVHETGPMQYPEDAHAHPTQNQTIIGVPDATGLRLLVDGVPLDTRDVEPSVHRRSLDLRTGVLERLLRWQSPAGATLELRSERLVSLTEQSLGAIRYRLDVVEGEAHVVLRSELALPSVPVDLDEPPFRDVEAVPDAVGGTLFATTRHTGWRVASAVTHRVGDGVTVQPDGSPEHVSHSFAAQLSAGRAGLDVLKLFGHVASPVASASSLLESARAVVDSGLDMGWDALVADQQSVLDAMWRCADVQVDGDDELQQALRYNVFTLFTNTVLLHDAPLGAKGLTGLGYDGHTFWDVEGFIAPPLSLLFPDAASRLLAWRASTLPAALDRARELDLDGAAFPWRTIDGREVSGYWPASTAAFHLNAAVARAFQLHANATGTPPEHTLAVLVATARMWVSLGHADADGAWHLFGVTGPDEYTGVVDDNVFTNLMASRNLRWAADACEAAPTDAEVLGVDADELAAWRRTADAVHVPFDDALGVHPMNTGFTSYPEWPFESEQDSYPVQKHHHYQRIYRHQVLKQADLELALWWCGDEFTDEQVARNLDYYEARTVRDSSLSASPQAVACAQAGHADLALRYLRESALVDLADEQGDTRDGLHLASVGGTWLAFACGLGGLRQDRDDLVLAPLLPTGLHRTSFRLTWRGRLLEVSTTRDGTTVAMLSGDEPVTVVIDDVPLTVAPDSPASAPLRPPTPLLPEPRQPAGRAPRVTLDQHGG